MLEDRHARAGANEALFAYLKAHDAVLFKKDNVFRVRVSGAAALLMARNSELVGDPRRVKRLLCESATDLGRERYFQGAGMLDVLRAMQAV